MDAHTVSYPAPSSRLEVTSMNSVKCQSCGLTNFSSEIECRRCGFQFGGSKKTKTEKRPRSFSFSTLLLVAGAAGLAYYFFGGVSTSVEEVNANEAKRVASQPDERPATPGLSRTEYDRQRSGHYGEAVKNSPSLDAHQQRVKDSEKAMQQISNSSTR
jgi:hypothetical protein